LIDVEFAAGAVCEKLAVEATIAATAKMPATDTAKARLDPWRLIFADILDSPVSDIPRHICVLCLE
jgi:hypothetical protein